VKIIITERQQNLILETFLESDSNRQTLKQKKTKNFLIKNDLDFTDKIMMIQSKYDLPKRFEIPNTYLNSMLNRFGPMFLIDFHNKMYLYQDRNNEEWFMDENNFEHKLEDIPKLEPLNNMGLDFKKVVDVFFEEDF
jgi:hypothetical protein